MALLDKEPKHRVLLESDLCKDPIEQFSSWLKSATENPSIALPRTMTLATASSFGVPSARNVMLADFNQQGFTFYTSYDSPKGKNLEENPVASLLFYWEPEYRSVRINGNVTKTTPEESNLFFDTRPFKSKIAACVLKQSEVAANKEVIEHEFNELSSKFASSENKEETSIPRPATWGGYTVHPTTIEFWQGGGDKVHDRILYTKVFGGAPEWTIQRLFP